MDKSIHTILNNVLKTEAQYIIDNEKDKDTKIKKMNTIFNLKKIIDNYDELEPVLIRYFNDKGKERWLDE